MAKAKHRGICPYCGREKNGTQEHVIPRTLFREDDSERVTTFICYQCNNGMSAAVRDLRNLIALHIGSSQHPDAEHHLRKMFETNEATQAWLKRTLDAAEPIDFVTDEGIIVGSALRFEFNQERARQALASVVRGLYFVEVGDPLPYDTPVSVLPVDPRLAPELAQNLSQYDHGPLVQKGNDVAAWVPFLTVEGASKETTVWLMWFLGGVCFLGGTGSVAAILENLWQEMLSNENELPMVNGRRQAKAPRLPDGTYWTPPHPWAEFE